jgi:hypothetical protein
MIWKLFIHFFILKPDINQNINQNIQYNKPNGISNVIPPTIDRWETLRNINKNNTELPIRKYSLYDGNDHRPFNEIDDMTKITINHLKMQLLKRLESKDVSINDKLESIDRNKWLMKDNDSSFYVNLLAGDLLDNW